MNQKHYLTNHSSEAKEMANNIRGLLLSAELGNIELALQLLKGGGVPQELITLVLALKKWHKNRRIKQEAEQLFQQFASSDLKKFVRGHWKKAFTQENSEVKIAKSLTLLSGHHELQKNDLGNMCLILTKRGGKFCLENQTTSYQSILANLIKYNELVLADFQLYALPEEVGLFPKLRLLDVSGNHFSSLPFSAKKLSNLQYIKYNNTPIPKAHLEEIFPHLFYVEYYNKGCSLKGNKKYLEAETHFRKSVQLKPDYPEAWHNIGASLIFAEQAQEAVEPLQEAIKYYDQRIQDNPNSAWDWFWKSCAFALLGKKNESFRDLKTCLQIDPSYKKKAAFEEDYRDYYEDEGFKKIIR